MREIPLTRGFVALVDDADYERVAPFKWYASPTGKGAFYARGTVPGQRSRMVYMHRIIMDAKPGQFVDHVNRNTMDNRRANLRTCTNQQNCANQRKRAGSSRFKGVHWSRKQRVWVASYHADYGTTFLGHFKAEEDAARAYDAAARDRFGEFARTNF